MTAWSCILAVVGVGATVLVGFVKRVATSYSITNRRLHIKKGIVSRTIQETRLERVQNVNVTQGVFQRLFQIGDVDFDTAAGDDYNFIFAGVAEPQEVVEKVDEATRSLHSQAAQAAWATSSTVTSQPPAGGARVQQDLLARPRPAVGYATASAPAASRSASAWSLFSQVKSPSSRPKWPYAAVG